MATNAQGKLKIEQIGRGADGDFVFGDLQCGLPPHILEQYRGKVQAIYLDPPLPAPQRAEYTQRIGSRGWKGDRAFTLNYPVDRESLEDREAFLALMRRALELAYELLSDTGVIFLHTDGQVGVPLRMMLDEIFGADHFLNEIIWHYKSGGRAKNFFSRKHDNILFYRKGLQHFFDIQPLGTPRGRQRRNHMRKEVDEQGRVFYSIKSGGKKYIYYEDEPVYPDDVWEDIAALQQKDPERTGYDTQKPEALIERLIAVTTQPGDIVCDLFAGSGTALAVAHRLGRRFLGMDCNAFSLHVVRRRLWALGAGFCIHHGQGADPLPDQQPRVRIESVLKDGVWTVDLLRYEIAGLEGFAQETNLVPELPLVDGWGIGMLDSTGRLEILGCALRLVGKPYVPLQLVMKAQQRQDALPAVWIADVCGGYRVEILSGPNSD